MVNLIKIIIIKAIIGIMNKMKLIWDKIDRAIILVIIESSNMMVVKEARYSPIKAKLDLMKINLPDLERIMMFVWGKMDLGEIKIGTIITIAKAIITVKQDLMRIMEALSQIGKPTIIRAQLIIVIIILVGIVRI